MSDKVLTDILHTLSMTMDEISTVSKSNGKSSDAVLKMIAELLQTLSMTMEEIAKASKTNGKQSDKTLESYSSIADSIDKMVKSLHTQKPSAVNVTVDTEPLARFNSTILKCLENIEDQQRTLTSAVSKLNPDAALFQTMLNQNYQMIKSLIHANQPSPKVERIEHPKEWSFEIERTGLGNRITKIIALAK